jgi:hypothetical protein
VRAEDVYPEAAPDAGSAAPPAASRRSEQLVAGDDERVVGICLSGGGVRAASFSLGVLQELGAAGFLRGPRRARYLAAVSGGSYLAGAAALVARGALPGEPDGSVVAAPDPFAPGTPEVHHLRSHLTYLLHGRGGLLGFAARMVLGIALNLGLVGLALHAVTRPMGWAYGWWYPSLREGARCRGATCDVDASVPIFTTSWVVVAVLMGLAVVIGIIAVARRWESDATRRQLDTIASGLAVAALIALVSLVGLPKLLELVRDTSGGHTGAQAAARTADRGGLFATGGLLGTIIAAVALARTWIGSQREVRTATTWVGRRLLPLLRRFRLPLLNAVAAIAGPLLVLGAAFVFINWGASHPPGATGGGGAGEAALWGALAVVLLVAYRWADLVSWSLHPFYKRQLSSAFAVRRVQPPPRPDGTVPPPTVEERPYDTWYRLSQSQPDDFPEVLICAAANISDYGVVPSGAHVTSFVFSAARVGGPLVGAIDTARLENAVGSRGRDITLPAAVAIAGAAVSPSMGKMTRAPLRFLITLTNLRLGVWVPNPRRVADFVEGTTRRVYPMHPRPSFLVRELLGRNHVGSRFLYVSDGGHYENLGLVELLRRRCTEVWCVDASGDSIDTFNTLAEAMLIARGELDVEIRLDPSVMAPDPADDAPAGAPRHVRGTHARGTIHYPDGAEGTIVVIKAGVPRDAPFEVRAFHASHPTFPCDSTLNQFFSAERFDAYRTLGAFAAARALQDVSGDGSDTTASDPAALLAEHI